ncbi:hypothetical protein [Pseudodesulfovibrio sp. zrk46]|uniref:hypothetical protein n=1 Tax=Pseudodesulfovibrio sp. zrk46 TaxID=2725288 RepID=UPI00144904E9|nr:hypothetical protein [Pseudodesulfovibrio sp. zrk46]QJB57954.1 hypothetical protein HFN16_16860 [Pseudodesulfovibrio sp. zrk46]
MRIKGSGSQFFGSGGGGSRSESFKRGRKRGQKVRGTILKWVSEDMAWVEIDGHRLLAQLHSHPPVGSRLTFLIIQLTPEIILKEIFESSSAGVGALTLAKDFETARILFEGKLQDHIIKLSSPQSPKRIHRFINILAEDIKLFSAYLDVTACLKHINHSLASTKNARLIYIPWLIPNGHRHIGLVRNPKSSPSLIETILELELEDFGMVRIEFLHKTPDTSYRVKLQHPSNATELNYYLESLLAYEPAPQCLGISPLQQHEHGGILSQILFKQ